MNNPPPLSLYVHFPWCVRKCPYCDFNSHPLHHSLDQNQYIQALIDDLNHELTRFTPSGALQSIFLGGGTPSLFEAESLRRLLTEVERRIGFAVDIEITMEANPGTTEHHDFDSYRSAGINRLSIGVQTFDPLQLKKLGRIHSPDDPGKALQSARQGGFENINIDLMFGLPQQSLDQALTDLDRALELKPEHLSLYQLTLEPNTVFYRYPPQVPDQDLVIEIQAALQAKLDSEDYLQYEVSAYSLKEKQCRHNLNYWQFGDYIGIGAGAHSKLTIDQSIIRRARKKHPTTYLAAAGGEAAVAESRLIRRDDILFEYLMNGLRLKHGFNLNTASKRTGHSPLSIRRVLHKHLNGELLAICGDNIKCTDKGYLFLDNILTDLL